MLVTCSLIIRPSAVDEAFPCFAEAALEQAASGCCHQ